jgi:hypothetical protein
VGIWGDTNNADVIVEQNWIELNYGEGVIYEISQNATIRGNVFLRNNIPKGAERYATDRSFPSATIFLSGAGGDPRLPSTLTGSAQILVEGNLLQDNWGGITAWEDSNRFCGSPANTSVGYCPRGSSASLRTCIPEMIDDEPYRTDCRWRTSSTTVRDNDFKVAPGSVPGCNARIVMVDEGAHQLLPCAMMALVASVGTEPSWSPYLGSVVQDAIVFRQRNVWLENRYLGPWTFSAGEPGTYLTFATWRSGPFNQDRLSSLQ